MVASGPTAALRIEAPAKINLYLHVLGRREDGYHRLDSLIAFAAVHDVVTARRAAALELGIDGPFADALPPGADNLVMRAARALAEAGGVTAGAAITLTKNLPVAAGIGGGSADAAAALIALDALWGTNLGPDALAAIGLGLGADVPACLRGETLYVGGIGDDIAPGPALPAAGLLLVNPDVALSTAAVFRQFGDAFSPADRLTEPVPDAAALAAALVRRRNDLTRPASALVPVIAETLAALKAEESCLLARLSGSGPTCFGLYADEAAAVRAGRAIAAGRPGWWVHATRFRDRPAVPAMPAAPRP